MFQRRNNSNRLYYAYQSMWVAVGKELPCQSEQENPEDPFASAGKLIIGRENFRSLVDAFDKMGYFSVEFTESVGRRQCACLSQLVSITFLEEEILASLCLIAKTAKISVLEKLPTIQCRTYSIHLVRL